ncbi:amidohydrolase family protein [Sphingomonas lutea]|uniref:Amidohydrolase family protein n=1 Tax=Sphingomonas lutea TaxID=1045317 RepID=A0A7G9SKC6_9SPHN|nr:amidohydrolase family protein [Sphingomonas lutea]QNN68301.1 amidohydrolase family protein [Sphingomonas lutea]
MSKRHAMIGFAAIMLASCATSPAPIAVQTSSLPAPVPLIHFDTIISGGMIYDGSGDAPYQGYVAISGDRIAAVSRNVPGTAATHIAANGMAVAPGFINMLSWATESLIEDGRGQGDIRQGVTLEVFGEGWSMGPLNAEMKALEVKRMGDIKYNITWTSLGEYLEHLERRGVSTNVASFVGATTVRVHELGEKDVDPNPEQLQRMRGLVRNAMQEGALGVGSSLIYAPANFAETPELVALTSEASKCGGMYISHIRDEGPKLIEAIDELVEISKQSGAPAEIYHFKQSGRDNWGKIDAAIARVEAARAAGQRITADMYTYPASSTGFDAAFPLWVQDGGLEAWVARLTNPRTRARALAEMRGPKATENTKLVVEEPDKVLLVGFKSEALKPLTGRTLGSVAKERGKRPEEVAADLIVADETRIQVVYFGMNEDNVRREVGLPWMSFGSDAASMAPEGVFLKSSTHPRAYGNFARLLGKYVRDEKAANLPDAIRRLTSLPATNLALKDRGSLKTGYAADIVIFDPATIRDHATFEKPHQLATGVRDVFVNGVQVLKDGTHTGAKPGRVVRGPGWTGWPGGGACK